jgi:hypothetical protein
MIQRAAVAAVLCLALFASVADAHSMNCNKPSVVPTGAAPTLQQILDGLVVSGPPIDASAPVNVELWQNSAAPMTAQIALDFTPEHEGLWFGMYDAAQGTKAFLLSEIINADLATVAFNDNGSITVHGGPTMGPQVGFDGPFGFFVKTFDPIGIKDSQYFFTQDALNPGSEPRAVVFAGDGTTTLKLPGIAAGLFLPGQFLIAWETGLGDANDGQFNDFLVLVSNIVPVTVPEPAFVVLLGISSLALICGRRARSA